MHVSRFFKDTKEPGEKNPIVLHKWVKMVKLEKPAAEANMSSSQKV